MLNKKMSAREIVGTVLVCAMCSIAFPDNPAVAWVAAGAAVGYVLLPLLVFAHELGHALAATVGMARPARIVLVAESFATSFRIGRIDVHIGRGSEAACLWFPDDGTPRRRLAVALAGPLVDLAFGLAFVLLAVEIDGPRLIHLIAAFAGAVALLSTLVNLSPRDGPWVEDDTPTDGANALRAIRDMRQARRGVA